MRLPRAFTRSSKDMLEQRSLSLIDEQQSDNGAGSKHHDVVCQRVYLRCAIPSWLTSQFVTADLKKTKEDSNNTHGLKSSIDLTQLTAGRYKVLKCQIVTIPSHVSYYWR